MPQSLHNGIYGCNVIGREVIVLQEDDSMYGAQSTSFGALAHGKDVFGYSDDCNVAHLASPGDWIFPPLFGFIENRPRGNKAGFNLDCKRVEIEICTHKHDYGS